MTSPRHYLTRMLLFLIVVAVVIAVLAPHLEEAFLANPALNGLIISVLVFGIAYIFRQVFMLTREVRWIESIRTGRPGVSVQARPILLAPMAAMLGERTKKFSLNAPAMRSLLDGVASRLDEQRDISRYLIGLLIFLGLLGTFWGLLQTISSVAAVISDLSVGSGGDVGAVFNDLKRGLKEPLNGMGTAFSTSLFGLAGSLALGFLELQAGQAQNRFYNDLEDWLSGQTQLGGAPSAIEGDMSMPNFVHAMLEQTADSLAALQRTLDRSEESRIDGNANINALTEKLTVLTMQMSDGQSILTERLTALTEQMSAGQSIVIKLAESQIELKPILAKLAEQQSGVFGEDGTRNHVRNIDVSLARLQEELATGRSESVQELRSEIRVLARTIAAAADKASR